MTTAAVLVLIVVLIAANGAFVALEFAAVGARRSVVEQEVARGRRTARAAQRIQGDLLLSLTGAQLGITMCSLALGRVAEPVIAKLIEDSLGRFVEISEPLLHTIGFATALALVVLVHMVVGEMVPKNVTLADPERTLFILSRPMVLYGWLAGPVIWVLNAISNAVLRIIRIEPQSTLEDLSLIHI